MSHWAGKDAMGTATAAAAPGTSKRGTGSAAATLEAFIGEHYDRLLRLAWLVTRDANVSADAVQNGLEQAWRHRSKLRDQDRMRSWLDRIVVRAAMRAGHKRRTWLQRLVGGPDAAEATIDMAVVVRPPSADWIAFRSAFGQLPAEQRAVVVLHLHLGYSVAETAELVGARIGTVRSRLRLARMRLRRELGEDEE
jgi:RNA polymerase sigma-70 factor, ECF subfamily